MPEKRNGLYYESMDIRNHVLERNIGEYRGYRKSMLANGGLAIGMPYAVETELTPWTLAERSQDGLHLNLAFTKDLNPRINVAWREGGLFGYTHEVINHPFDPLLRNYNIYETFYDYDSTEDVKFQLNKVYDSHPWGRSIEPWSERGLRPYSSHNEPQNAEYYDTYTDYVNEIFTNGLSFQKSLGQNYNGRLLADGFSRGVVEEGPAKFIDEMRNYITEDVETLKQNEDTKVGYVGKILLDEQKIKQINNVEREGKELPITPFLNLYYGLSTAALPTLSEGRIGGVGKSYYFDTADSIFGSDRKFINEIGNDHEGQEWEDVDYEVIEPQIQYLNDIHERAVRTQSFYKTGFNGDFYIDYFNNGESEYGGESVDGKFAGTGVEDSDVAANEHYDEHDESGKEERRITSAKISYNEPEFIGIDSDGGFTGTEDSLLKKTKDLFKQHKIKTLIGRFHTSDDDAGAKFTSLTQSALNSTYGISHGRNLLKKDPKNDASRNGYDNPYCRVWTYHHQYAKMTDLIRPFSTKDKFVSIEELQANYPGRPILADGSNRGSWSEKTVLNKNGMVNIAPSAKIGPDDTKKVEAKQCMFSIENLAWKGVLKDKSTLDEGEVGPLGGRIMWFPPYNLQFNESVSVSWGANDFIGRGEKIYSYTNTERSGTLSFTILADHPSILDYWLNSNGRRSNTENRESDQQDVLRFFAGCGDGLEVDRDTLQNSREVSERMLGIKENQKNDPKGPNDFTDVNPDDTTDESLTVTPPDEFTKDNSIGFYVYFPNNLSGVDFVKNPKVIVNYLVHGQDGFEFNPSLEGGEMSFDPDGNGTALLPADGVFVGDWSDKILVRTPGDGPGYEMGRGHLTEDSIVEEIKNFNKKKENDNGRNYIWGYGVDVDKVKERLCGPYGAMGDKTMKLYPSNYCDSTDHSLNAKPNEHDNACAYSFMDVAEAITTDYKYTGKGNAENVQKIKEILGINDDKVRANRKYYFGIAGGASVHGYVDRNTGLSERRAAFLRSWLEDCFKKLNLQVDYDANSKIPTITGIEGGEENLDINSESAKRGRYAKAVIYWGDEAITDMSDAQSDYNENAISIGTYKEQKVPDDTDNVTNEDASESTTYLSTALLRNLAKTRYGDEELFFEMLKESDPVIYKNIVDKVRFFDPIYHSITPEGFNARLSFLHQCTRQGPTMSSSDITQNYGINGAGYAGNLAFGRAPVCVLRLGDFYNTRIVINSLSIQYETGQWDLNPEGIGVQPMLANVTLGFVFQGGSSLGGPIQRLQNAVSFNYYANQEVYDDRADVAVYKNRELSEESLVWMPGYGTLNLGDVKKILSPPQGTTIENIADAAAVKEALKQKLEAEAAAEKVAEASDPETSGQTEAEHYEQV